MNNTLGFKTTIYDILGYVIPGLILFAEVYLCMNGLDVCSRQCQVIKSFLSNHSLVFTAFVLIAAYIAGHMVNSLSSWSIEKHLLLKQYNKAKNWFERLSAPRKKIISDVVCKEYGCSPGDLSTFDIRVRMEANFSQPSVTGLTFLSFYGMARSAALLSATMVVPLLMNIPYSRGECCCTLLATLGVVLLCAMTFILFTNQYLRFVEYYYDFLGSTLTVCVLPKKDSESVKGCKKIEVVSND